MVYTTTSVKPIIAQVIRNTRMTDMTYADDIIEWIGEGINRMMIRWRLPKTHKVLTIINHKHKLPCELVTLDAVIYKGARLRKGTGCVDVRIKKWRDVESVIDSYFVSDPSVTPTLINQQNAQLLRGSNITQINEPSQGEAYYTLKYDYIETSFEEGEVTICYTQRELDNEGYPMVPDLQEVRDSLFWYVCSMLVFTGYKLPDPSMDFSFCDNKATKGFRKAKDIIKEPSLDEKEAAVQLLNNLVPPRGYYESFFIGGEQRKFLAK